MLGPAGGGTSLCGLTCACKMVTPPVFSITGHKTASHLARGMCHKPQHFSLQNASLSVVSIAAVPACPCGGPELGGGSPEAHILGGELKPPGAVAPCFGAHGDLSVLVNGSFRAGVQFRTQSSALSTALMTVLGAKDCVRVVVRVVRSDTDWGSGT